MFNRIMLLPADGVVLCHRLLVSPSSISTAHTYILDGSDTKPES
jgi:hypothetical protein